MKVMQYAVRNALADAGSKACASAFAPGRPGKRGPGRLPGGAGRASFGTRRLSGGKRGVPTQKNNKNLL